MGNERVLLIAIEINIQGVTGTMSFFIPFNTLKPIADVLNPHIWIAGRKEHQMDPVARQVAIQTMMKAVIPIKVILGNADLTLKDLMGLSIGDVIELDQSVENPWSCRWQIKSNSMPVLENPANAWGFRSMGFTVNMTIPSRVINKVKIKWKI
ncbi:FliM/FliN family flagellar motor switch protein [Candidatus Villigracilis saccharophilus]|uniref:FliM/FliN family flagellar motor switch protein n=1 Tax=Candidatus Villigracilis saccharophilus TaxID=3140684 RepID=UPI00313535A9|nr:FliM/FliN family flagellar motor switch protein [Anaerolineales bacterium]